MNQEVKQIKLKDLVLWTENPRDPISATATDQDIVDRALDGTSSKWNLLKLADAMGEHYDFSELPTVVYREGKPVVYDGNRRIMLGKIKHGLVKMSYRQDIKIPFFPKEIPCNVCTEEIALKNIFRKHSDTGSWLPLERDIFLHKYMGEKKSAFLILDESTKLITANPQLNQRFVKEEIFKEELLKKMGFSLSDGKLCSVHNDEQAYLILSDIAQKIMTKVITTRKNRGRVIEVLEPLSQEFIDRNRNKKSKYTRLDFEGDEKHGNKANMSQSRRTIKKEYDLFGGKLYLRMGNVSNLYRDIKDLYQFYVENKERLSHLFTGIIRMSLRLLCESAAQECNNGNGIDQYIKSNFEAAKKTLNQDIKTTLSNQNITEKSIVQLLHTGAHKYHSSDNIQQTIAISIIIGAMLTITHGQGKET